MRFIVLLCHLNIFTITGSFQNYIFLTAKIIHGLLKKKKKKIRDFPSGPVEEILPFHCRDPGFHPWQLGSCMTHSSSKKKKKIKSTPHPYPTSGAPSVLPYASCLGVTVVCLKEFFFNWWIILNIKFCKCSYTFKAWNIREKKVQIFLCSIWSLATSLQTPPHLHIFFFFFGSHHPAWRIIVSQPGIEPESSAVKARRSNP